MKIGPVTIRALLKRQRFLEVPTGVALHTLHFGVPAKKRKFRLGMVKSAIQRGRRNLLPARGVVTRLTGLRKTSTVGIRMTIGAIAESDSRVARLFVPAWRVALLARYLDVQTSQRIAGDRMVERAETDHFPITVVVTLQAVWSQPPLVLVLMAIATAWRNSQKCSAQIFHFDDHTFTRGHALRRVTPGTVQPRVFTLEPVAGLRVIESLKVPLDQGEVFSVVLGVAVRAFHARTWLDVVGSVEPLSHCNAPRNLAVTIQTLEGGLPGRKLVAGGALGHAIDRLVGAGKRARRNLGCHGNRGPQDTQHNAPQNYGLRESTNTLHEARFQNRDVCFDVTAAR